MPLPPDIDQRIERARAKGFTDAQIQADIQRKYGATPAPASAPTPPTKQKLGVAGGIASFLGTEDFGKGIGRTIFNLTGGPKAAQKSAQDLGEMNQKLLTAARALPKGDPRRERLLGQVKQNMGTLGDSGSNAEDLATGGLTNRQLLTSAGMTGLNILGAGTFGAKTVGQGAMGSVKLAELPLKLRALQSGIVSGGMAGFGKANKGGTLGESLKSAAIAAPIGAGLTFALGGLAKLHDKSTTDLPEATYKVSTRMPRGSRADILLKEGVTGSRSKLSDDLAAKFADVEQQIKAMASSGDILNPEDILKSPAVQSLQKEAARVGELEAVNKTLVKIMPKGGGVGNIATLQEKANELAAKATEPGAGKEAEQAFLEAFRQLNAAKEATPFTRLEALAQRRAIDRATPASAFADTATGLEARTKNAVADVLRKMIGEGAPELKDQLAREQQFAVLQKAIDATDRSRSSLGIGGISTLGHGLLTPAIGTRLARAGYLAGAPARALSTGALSEGVRNALRSLILGGTSNVLAGGQEPVPKGEADAARVSLPAVLREVPSVAANLMGIKTAEAAPLPPAKDSTDKVARQIATIEGYKKTGTLADRQKNPGNLRFVGQKGATKGAKGFAVFKTHEDGWNALRSQIKLDASRGLTLERFIHKYAPPTENNTKAYINSLVRTLGVSAKTPLSKIIK